MGKKTAVSFPFLFISAFFIGLFIKFFIFDVITITGNSMYPALRNNQQVIVKKLAYKWKKPAKNDIILFHHENKMVVKRVAYIEGEELEILEDSGYYYLLVGGEKISLSTEQYLSLCTSSRVPENYIFVLGDNSSESFDSRTYGFVSLSKVIGKIR